MKRMILFLMLSLLLLTGCNTPTPPVLAVTPAATLAAAPANTLIIENTPTASQPSPQPTEPQAVQMADTATSAPARGAWIAYIGLDGNVWLVDPLSGQQQGVRAGPARRPAA